MGSGPSRERPLSISAETPGTAQPPLPAQAGECLQPRYPHVSLPPAPPGAVGGALSPVTIPTAPGALQALALCDFPSGSGAILRMGEQLRVLSEDGDWWLVASEVSGKECHIPSSCVARIRHRWLYEGISRQKAEELLLRPGNGSGSFLIRESQTRRGCFSLSVRRCEQGCWAAVSHYRIHRLDNGWLYIVPRLTFPSLHSLVEHYSELGEGLCCALGEPCSIDGVRVAPAPAMPTVVRKPSLNWDKMDSSLLLDTASPPEDSPISLGLREAVSSYLLLTGAAITEEGAEGKNC
ncbi:src-like-adapter 2 [Melopsittacus undulatus]|uniref:src-like-adapter 2 n=1 Tax=Melopsittacus undulatus TaxID=13146 RepID=UPI00146B2F42|nr:src-like-adapter 2 [Melopsittacus undulatus]